MDKVTDKRILNKIFNFYFFQSGKTFLCNFLADATEFSGGEYHPTQGVRWAWFYEMISIYFLEDEYHL